MRVIISGIIYLVILWLASSAQAQWVSPTPIGTAINNEACVGCVGEVKSANAQGTTTTITVTIASPGVMTWTGHGFSATTPTPVNLTTDGALPTGLVAATNYWTIPPTITTDTFQLATSIANAIAGTAINTSGSQSGTHTGINSAIVANGIGLSPLGISLTAGDWSCTGGARTIPASGTTTQVLGVGINTAVNTIGNVDAGNGTNRRVATVGANLVTQAGTTPSRQLLAATTTVYLATAVSFSISTMTVAAYQECRRMR